jgi:hypothetical protein
VAVLRLLLLAVVAQRELRLLDHKAAAVALRRVRRDIT